MRPLCVLLLITVMAGAQAAAEGPNPLFNICVADETKLADVDLAVSFKAVEGEKDHR